MADPRNRPQVPYNIDGPTQTPTEARKDPASGVATQSGATCASPDCDFPISGRPGQRYCSSQCRNLAWRLEHPRPGTAEAAQASLFDQPKNGTGTPTIQARFEAWLDANPDIWYCVRRHAYQALESRRKIGIAAIVERVRWYVEIESRGDPFKINNSFRSRIVRKLIEEDPRFAELFETRKLKAD